MVQRINAYRPARVGFAVVAAGVLALTAACSSSSSSGTPAQAAPTDAATVAAAKAAGFDFTSVPGLSATTIDVGQLLALTGPGTFFGKVMGNGSKLAADQIRAAGGPNIVFKQGDNKTGSPEASVTSGRQLVSQDKVSVIQSSFGASTLALIPLIGQTKTLTFNPAGATSDQLSKSPYLWMAGYESVAVGRAIQR